MKASVKRIMLMVMVLVVISTASVFAVQEKSTVEKGASETGGLKLNADEYITAATINYSTSKKSTVKTIYTDGAGDYYTIYSIAAKATGKLYVDAYADSSNTYGASIGVGTSDGSTFNHYSSGDRYVSAGQTDTAIGGYDVKKGKTYYVGIKSSAAAYANVTAYVIPYTTRTLPAGKTMIASGKKGSSNNTSAVKFKIKPKKNGYINVNLKQYGYSSSYGKVTLLNSKGKALSEKLTYNSGVSSSYVVFGVKKGTAYYLKVNDCYGSYTEAYAYGIRYTIKSASLKKNTKKSKAVTLKRKAKAKSMLRPATGKSMKQWYKFKVPKKQATRIQLDASKIKSGSAKIMFYYGSKKIDTRTVYNGSKYSWDLTYSTTWGKANKGTYYVVISSNKKCSGMYKIRYVK